MAKGRPFRASVVGGRGRGARGACDRPYAATDGRTAAGRPARAAATVVRLTSYATHTRAHLTRHRRTARQQVVRDRFLKDKNRK